MFPTADLCDKYAEAPGSGFRVLDAALRLRLFGKKRLFGGRVETVSCYEDNSLVRAALERAGEGRVLVVDGGGSFQCALVGDVLAGLAMQNGWAGIVVYGCIRDSSAIDAMDVGILALGTHPQKSKKTGQGAVGVSVSFGGVKFEPSGFVYVDEDGLVYSPGPLTL